MRTSSRNRTLTAALILVIGVAVAAYALNRSGGSDGFYGSGPLWLGDPGDSTVSGSATDVGGQVIWGNVTMVNKGIQALTLTRITLNPSGDVSGVRVDAMYIVDIEQHHGDLIGMSRTIPAGYDTPDNMRPVAGYVVTPRTSSQALHQGEYQMLVQVTVTKPGSFVFSSFSVYYQVAGQSYVAEHGDGLTVCTPMSASC
jgi:hypothetical protein